MSHLRVDGLSEKRASDDDHKQSEGDHERNVCHTLACIVSSFGCWPRHGRRLRTGPIHGPVTGDS